MSNWVYKLIKEYSIGKKELEEYREQLDKDNPCCQKDYEIIGSMISDMQYAIDWMRRGSKPDFRRGIERRSVYQRTVLLDTDIFPSLQIEPEEELTNEEKKKLVDMLWKLSERERQCFVLNKAYGMSYGEIADEIKLSRSTVQQYVERARSKIKELVAA